MTTKLARTALAFAALVALTAVPAFPSQIFNFNFDSGSTSNSLSGTGTSTTGAFSVDNFAEGTTAAWPGIGTGSTLLFKISFNNSTGNFEIQSLAGSTCSPCGDGAKSLTDLGVLYNATTTLSGGVSGSNLNETVSGVWTSVNTTFLSELGLAAGTDFIISGSISGSSTAVTSDTLTLTAFATPEPAPAFLLGAGLLVIGALARKRRLATNR